MCAICQLPITHEAERIIIANYVDPGSGQVIQSIIPAILAFLSAFLASIGFFLRRFFRNIFQKKIVFTFLLVLLFAGIIGTVLRLSQNAKINSINKRVIVLAFDGLDPNMLEEGIKQNLLPNFQKLKETGYYSPLETTNPPQSPVAWASFATGVSPAKHGVYDFITRNPQNYQLDLTFSVKDQVKTTPFWELTTQYNIPTTILFLPDTFPPSKLSGKMLSGMGVPDLTGTLGTLTLITTKDYPKDTFRGKIISIPNETIVKTSFQGPKYKVLNDTKISEIPIEIIRDANTKSLTIKMQDKIINLEDKKFSDWVQLDFKIDFLTKINGMVKFYVKEVSPQLEVYISPININPQNPYKPISYPGEYAKELVKEYGLFSTLGLPQDTWALDQGIFDEQAFLAQSDTIVNERRKIYSGELTKFKEGLFFGYFGMTDSIQHMFWRFLDDPTSKYQHTILDAYQKADEIVGETLSKLQKDDTLIILSDHGFNAFDYEINMNSWLQNNGYLVLKNNKKEGAELLEDVDWSKTQAYAIGYNGVYFNRKGREKDGIVDEDTAKKLEGEITDKLVTLDNPFTKTKAIKRVYTRSELGIADTDSAAPDLFIGFYKGIRSSWDSAVGAAKKDVIKRRESKWSGDHLFDASEVPGVLLVNKKINYNNPKIIDIMPTILGLFNISSPKDVDGIDLIKK